MTLSRGWEKGQTTRDSLPAFFSIIWQNTDTGMWTSQAWSIYNTALCLNHIHTVYITRVASTANMLHLYIPIPEIPTKFAMHVSRTHKHTTHIPYTYYAQIEAQASILFQPFSPNFKLKPNFYEFYNVLLYELSLLHFIVDAISLPHFVTSAQMFPSSSWDLKPLDDDIANVFGFKDPGTAVH